ncbi:MAG: hypothetical protein ACOH2E_01500 [Candidatus Paracaedibacter sp.]
MPNFISYGRNSIDHDDIKAVEAVLNGSQLLSGAEEHQASCLSIPLYASLKNQEKSLKINTSKKK